MEQGHVGGKNQRIFGLKHVHHVCLVVIIQLGRKKYINNNSIKQILQHTTIIHIKEKKNKSHCFCKK